MNRSTGAPTPPNPVVAAPHGPREPSRIDGIADRHLDRLLALDPSWAIELNAPTHGWGYADYGPDGAGARHQALMQTLRELDGVPPADDVDRVTEHALRERIGVAAELHEQGLSGTRINGISSPVQKIREAFDNLPKNTEDDWEVIVRQLAELPATVDGLIRGIRARQADGPVTAAPQLIHAAGQAESYAAEHGSFMGLTHRPTVAQLPATMQELLRSGVREARKAYTELAGELREIARTAPEDMAVGMDEYRLRLREYTGAGLDPVESFEWGIDQLREVVDEMEQTAREILPEHAGRDRIAAAMAALDADPYRQLHGRHELVAWMQGVSRHAIGQLAGTHFEITDPMRNLECRIAPTTDGGIYYTPPSEDFERPGRMWWSVPEGTDVFHTWRERTTVYHEGVPGHHLQFATSVAAAGSLNAWRRIALWVSGHGEGWALYAERLMAQWGFLDDPGDRMGMLNAQRMRAARVVFDIGFHCGLRVPREIGPLLGAAQGAHRWTPEAGWAFLKENIVMGEASLRFEWMRYMGWPGQAPSYQLGQRVWENARDSWAEAAGLGFSLAGFHRHALSLGSLGLDTLNYALDLMRDPATHPTRRPGPPSAAS
ncbi:DUF885 domain-containing protein [Kocuria coralli]|uniref:DUF885 domain-containing protein n=1 Tax=Kocuria coralli TaxID=1461025 RepID=A0A5J5KY76_9MICC|nr:DUF885 domain-containing protein [Kocuria coralli]KAA9393776.1 DUF885 domain-containing protein [Kocuria coralli]